MRKRALLVGALTCALVPFVGVSPAHACLCSNPGGEKSYFEEADVVFQGTIPNRDERPAGPVTFAATRVYKGSVAATQQVSTEPNSSCSAHLPGNGPFLVFAGYTDADHVLATGACTGTRPMDASETLSFGRGVPVALTGGPTDADGPGPWSTALPVVYFAGGAGLLAVALLRRRRRPPG